MRFRNEYMLLCRNRRMSPASNLCLVLLYPNLAIILFALFPLRSLDRPMNLLTLAPFIIFMLFSLFGGGNRDPVFR